MRRYQRWQQEGFAVTAADRYNLDDARRFLSLLARPGDVFELRGLAKVHGQPHVTAGYFDDLEQLARAAADRSGKDDGVYVTLNPVVNALLARLPKNKVHRVGNGQTTSDRDVRQRRSLLIDIDPVRPAGISSSNEEHKAAIALARRVRDELIKEGWPLPIFADSGNGAHLIYAVELPVDDGGLIKRVLAQLSKRYTTPEQKVDEKVFNAARISKIYGTLTRKGEDTEERPHRLARIIEAPERLLEVQRSVLDAFAPDGNGQRDAKPKTDRPHAGRAEFDLDAWRAKHLPDAKERDWSEGKKWIVPICPFNDQHDRGECFVVQKHDGSIAAGCQHESCFKTWRELRLHFEPDAYERRNGNGHTPTNGNGQHAERRLTDREPPPEVLYEDRRFVADIARVESTTDAEYERIAAQDRDEKTTAAAADTAAKRSLAWRAPELVDQILARAGDPWIGLTLAGDELIRARVGATIVLIGGSGSGKSSLTSCFLIEHAKNVGPAIALSIELPADELAARIVGIKCDASWEEALRGQVTRADMERALDLPRLFVLDRRKATLGNLEKIIDEAKTEFPGQPILVAIDYAQLLDSNEREVRQRVADVFAKIDDVAREKKVVALALSQMSRVNTQKARQGEAIGAESAALGAESAAIERWATATLSIGMATEREDGSSAVEFSVGKGRMTKGDRVFPMTYWGKSGLWRVAGEAKKAEDVRTERDAEREKKARSTVELAMLGAARQSVQPVSRQQLMEAIQGRKATKTAALAVLLSRGDLIEVDKRQLRSKYYLVWTPDRARDAGLQPRQTTYTGEG